MFIGVTACDSTTPQTGATLTPILLTPTTLGINITKEEYEQALSKWRSQAIEEYAITVRYSAYSEFMGIWTLQVQSNGAAAKVLDYVREPGLEAPVGGVGSHSQMPTTEDGIKYLKEQLQDITVEGQFESITQVFGTEWHSLREVNVGFDPKFGYPSHVGFLPSPRVSESSIWSVITFKVLKGASGIPLTPWQFIWRSS